MIEAVATRFFRHEGKRFEEGERCWLSEGRYAEWRAAGLVMLAPPRPPRSKAPRSKAPRSKAAPKP
jgi:hypothetical protein